MSLSPLPALDTGTRLALDRTRLAYERTMMAWIRTATSLISFGFAIYKFFELDLKSSAAADRLIGSRGFALLMIGVGLVALLLAGIQHRQGVLQMKGTFGTLPRSVASEVAALVALLGIAALIGVIVRA
jgi:putative membrane protein